MTWFSRAMPTCRATATAEQPDLRQHRQQHPRRRRGRRRDVRRRRQRRLFRRQCRRSVIENAGEGIDAVFSTAHFRLTANVEYLVLQGSADLQGYGKRACNAIFGNTGNNLLDGGAGADAMSGGAGNDIYFVDNAGDVVFENAGEGTDVVFSSAHFGLSANVETLVLQGSADTAGLRQQRGEHALRQHRQQSAQRRGRCRHHARRRGQRRLLRRQRPATSYSRTSTRVPMQYLPRSTTR